MSRKRSSKGGGSLYRPAGRKIWMFKSPPGKDGKAITISTGTEDRTKAEGIRRNYLAEMERGISLDSHRLVFADLASDMVQDFKLNDRKTIKDLIHRLDLYILPVLGKLKATEITSVEITSFISIRKDKKASNAEINRELSIIRRVFNLAQQRERISRKPHIKMLKESKIRKGTFWKEGEFKTLLKKLSTDIQPIVQFMWHTGWRVSDVQNLYWHNIDWNNREIRLNPGSTKNEEGETRIFPFIPGLEELLIELKEKTVSLERKSGKIIPWVFYRYKRIRAKSRLKVTPIRAFNKDWYAATKAAGIIGKKRHDFRSTAARNLLKLGFHPHESLLDGGMEIHSNALLLRHH